MSADNVEATEDPLQNLQSRKVDENEDDDGAVVDYRRMLGKGKKNAHKIPKRGEKDFEPDGTRKQQNLLQEARDAMYEALSSDIGLKQGAACGVWVKEYEMAHVPKELCTGPWFRSIGFGAPSGQWLLPEETLLMVSSGRIELLDEDGFEIDVLGAWGACIEPAGGVIRYLVYSQLRRAGYIVFRPGYLEDKLEASSGNGGLSKGDVRRASLLERSRLEAFILLRKAITYLITTVTSLFYFIASYLKPPPHRPYDFIYRSLPPIHTFSHLSMGQGPDALEIHFEVWCPNPQWRKKAPGPPDFHICVLDGREDFPSLSQLEHLNNSVSQKHQLGKTGGKIVLVVVDKGITNYLTLDEKLLALGKES